MDPPYNNLYGNPVFGNQSPYQQPPPFIPPESHSQPPPFIPPAHHSPRRQPPPLIPPESHNPHRQPPPFIPPESHSPYRQPPPFIFPESHSPYGQPSPFIPPAHHSPHRQPPPFIPPAHHSPRRQPPPFIPPTNSSPLLGTPNTPLHSFVPYENYYNYGPGGWERRTDSSTSFNNFIPSWIATPHPRRDYFNGVGWPSTWLPAQVISGYPLNYLPIPSELSLHPLLSGDSGRTVLIFDLSSPKFDPMKRLGSNTFERLSEADQQEPATWPGLNRLRIECDLVPEWPIRFDLHRSQSPLVGTHIPLITLGMVLAEIYRHFSQRIRHEDWAVLTLQDRIAVGEAYTERCTALGSAEVIERSHGVRRIDYTRGKVRFKRLTRGGDGLEVLKLHLDKP